MQAVGPTYYLGVSERVRWFDNPGAWLGVLIAEFLIIGWVGSVLVPPSTPRGVQAVILVVLIVAVGVGNYRWRRRMRVRHGSA